MDLFSMKIYYNPHLKDYSRKLRTQMTDAELKFWNIVRKKQIENIQFFRQRPIGAYIVDFISLSHKIIIEIDGSQHYEVKHKIKDRQRENYLNKLGFMVIRYNDREVLTNIEGVKEGLYQTIKSLPTSL